MGQLCERDACTPIEYVTSICRPLGCFSKSLKEEGEYMLILPLRQVFRVLAFLSSLQMGLRLSDKTLSRIMDVVVLAVGLSPLLI